MDDASESLSSGLGATAALAEQGFLAAGESLENAVAILDRLTHRFADYVADLTGEALCETRRDLASAGERVAALAAARQTAGVALEALQDIATGTGHRLAALLPVPREVETLSLSARIVAGGMGTAAADFAIFAGNIRDAAQHARACLDGACTALGQVGRDVAAARAEADAFMQRHGGAMRTIPTRLAGNLRSLEAHQRLAACAATEARRRSEEVRSQVAQQIVALQLGDITRQRLEHVQAAAQILTEQGCRAGDLLTAQLEDTADELVRGGEGIEAGLRQLAAAARAIGQLGIELHDESHAGGFVAALEADIGETAALFAELGVGDAATDQRMQAVLAAAGVLTERLASVQSVQEDIRIMGLNATLKCGRLGPMGRALAAVAQELRLCSGRFGASAASVLRDLARLRPIAAELSDPTRRGEHSQLAQATDSMLAPLRRLGRLEQGLSVALSELQADAREVSRLVEEAVAQFLVRHELAGTLRAAAGTLAGQGDAGACARDVLDRIASGYTMAREREVHARFAPLPSEAAADEFADVLF